jgi:GTP-binding protein
VDVSSGGNEGVVEAYTTINRELRKYDSRLAERPQIVIATKADAVDEPERIEELRKAALADRREFFEISSASGKGVKELVSHVAALLREMHSEIKLEEAVSG